MQQIIPNVYTFTGLMVGRVYLIADPDGLTLIDASIPPSVGPIMNQIKAMGKGPRDVKRILLTHAHPDHVGDLPKLKALTGAQIIASAIEQPVIEGKMAVPRVDLAKLKGPIKLRPPHTIYKPVAVDMPLQGGEILPVLGGLQVIFTPGHAPGHVSFWQPQQRLLFCGDVLFNAPKFGLPPMMVTVDMDEDKRSVRKIAELNPDIICFGHGQPLTRNAAQTLRDFAATLG